MKLGTEFLPITREECNERGWDAPDFVYVSGDAYVDHPSFGPAIITRVLESKGYRVAILSQPDYRSAEDFKRFGKPKLEKAWLPIVLIVVGIVISDILLFPQNA